MPSVTYSWAMSGGLMHGPRQASALRIVCSRALSVTDRQRKKQPNDCPRLALLAHRHLHGAPLVVSFSHASQLLLPFTHNPHARMREPYPSHSPVVLLASDLYHFDDSFLHPLILLPTPGARDEVMNV